MNNPEPLILRVRNWSGYQHYRHRNPPWIKLHYDLLSSRDWVMLSDAGRVLAITSMLLASHSGLGEGQFNADPDYVRRMAHLQDEPYFKPLIDIGFLEIVSGTPADFENLLAKVQKNEKNSVPFREIVELYHEKLPELSRVIRLTDGRKGHLDARWHEGLPSIEHWDRYFTMVKQSRFLMGEVEGLNGHAFKADFDFLINSGNAVKIVEGKYANRNDQNPF